MDRDPLHTVMPWRRVAAGFLNVLLALPNALLGGILTFKKKHKERWTHGEDEANQFIRRHRALWNPSSPGRARTPEWWHDASYR